MTVSDLVPAVIVAMIFATVIITEKRKKTAALRLLVGRLNGNVDTGILSAAFKGIRGGLRYEISIAGGLSEDRNELIRVRLLKGAPFTLHILKKPSVFDSFARSPDAWHRVRSADTVFNKDYSVFSSSPERAALYLNSEAVRKNIAKLVYFGYDDIWLKREHADASKPYYKASWSGDIVDMPSIIEKLLCLVDKLKEK